MLAAGHGESQGHRGQTRRSRQEPETTCYWAEIWSGGGGQGHRTAAQSERRPASTEWREWIGLGSGELGFDGAYIYSQPVPGPLHGPGRLVAEARCRNTA